MSQCPCCFGENSYEGDIGCQFGEIENLKEKLVAVRAFADTIYSEKPSRGHVMSTDRFNALSECEARLREILDDTGRLVIADETTTPNETADDESKQWTCCPGCKGPADNGHDRMVPPCAYLCTKCTAPNETETT